MPHNLGADIFGDSIGSVGTASTAMLSGAAYSDGSNGGMGGLSALTRTVLHIAVFWVISIGVLILLHRSGFRFSLTVG